MNRTLSTAPDVTATVAVVEDSWIRLSGTSKPMVALILKKAIRMRLGKDNVVFNGPTWELRSPVRFSKNRGGTPLQEPNKDVPLDGVAFSRLE